MSEATSTERESHEVATASDKIKTGFDNPVLGSQSVFRQLLKSMSEPGIQSKIEPIKAYPNVLYPASYVIALGLFDQDTPVFLSKSLQSPENLATLRFQVSLSATDNPIDADFVVCDQDEMPSLNTLNLGNEEYPDQSCTLIIQCNSFEEGEPYRATGPGIESSRIIQCSGLNKTLFEQREQIFSQFPLGIDIIFTHKNKFFCLPRTTRLEQVMH